FPLGAVAVQPLFSSPISFPVLQPVQVASVATAFLYRSDSPWCIELCSDHRSQSELLTDRSVPVDSPSHRGGILLVSRLQQVDGQPGWIVPSLVRQQNAANPKYQRYGPHQR